MENDSGGGADSGDNARIRRGAWGRRFHCGSLEDVPTAARGGCDDLRHRDDDLPTDPGGLRGEEPDTYDHGVTKLPRARRAYELRTNDRRSVPAGSNTS